MNTDITQNIDKAFDTVVARFFSESTIRAFLNDTEKSFSVLEEFYFLNNQIENSFNGKTYRDLFEFAYDHLLKNYRNEYIYKNAIANKILLGKHSLNTSFMLQEFRVGNCKVDTVVLNGTSNAYEIKSELDSLERLKKQVETYMQVFDMVHVITYPGQSKRVKQEVPSSVGLMELTKENRISTIRDAKSGKKKISPSLLFDSLRRGEYQEIIKIYYGITHDVPNTKAYGFYKEKFVKIDPEIAHDLTIATLKKRGDNIALKDFILSVPEYFKSLSINGRFSKSETTELQHLLNTKLKTAV